MSENNEIAIKVQHISKTFHEQAGARSFKEAFVGVGRKLTGKKEKTLKKGDYTALKDINFEVKKGEFFGIVGRNGSGKSTLLKIIAGVYSPTKGAVTVNGKLTPFIELGVGFNPELSGRDNVFLNGALLGFTRKQMEEMYDDIVEFAELKEFMDVKLKNYSSGMQVRLAFSVAIRAESDILLIDEVLAVGDAAFQQKCYEYFGSLKKADQTVVLVTHDMAAVTRFCDKALLLDGGGVLKVASPKEITDDYLELNYAGSKINSAKDENPAKTLKITKMTFNKRDTTSQRLPINTGDYCSFILEFKNPEELDLHFGIQIFNNSGTYCFGANTSIAKLSSNSSPKGGVILSIKLDLVPGNYTVTGAIMNHNATKVLVYRPKMVSFRVSNTTETEGVANLKHEWSIKHV